METARVLKSKESHKPEGEVREIVRSEPNYPNLRLAVTLRDCEHALRLAIAKNEIGWIQRSAQRRAFMLLRELYDEAWINALRTDKELSD